MNRAKTPRQWLCLLSLALASARCSTPSPPAQDAATDAGADTGLEIFTSPDATLDGAPSDAAMSQASDAANDTGPSGPVTARFEVPRGTISPNQFLLPWPSDLAVDARGRADLRFIPGVLAGGLARSYVDALNGELQGFSPAGAAYFRFSGSIDPTSLPANPTASLGPDASVRIVDVDPASPEVGRAVPVTVQFRERSSRYWPAFTLAVAPAPGFPLRPTTRYAVIVTDALRGADRTPVRRDADLSAALSETPPAELSSIARMYRPALERVAGLDRARVVSMAVFTTSDPTSEFFRAVDVTLRTATAPTLQSITREGSNEMFATWRGLYGPNPVFQAGDAPYLADGSGDFVAGPDGAPRIQRYEPGIEFALTVPVGPMPSGGWPIAIYAHGTGGNAGSFISDGTARALAAQGVACLGFDQLFNGARTIRGGTPESQFFNFANPRAARSNNRQAALDLVQAARFVRALALDAVQGGGAEVRFDSANPMFFGHSQGGLNGPLWLAAPQGPAAAVLSGAGGWLSLSLVLKTEPINIPGVVAGLLSIPRDELTPLHPAITLAQMITDPADPAHYARAILREPRAGGQPKNVFLTQGFIDRYTPPPAIAALATAIGLPLIEPVLHPDVTAPVTDWPRARAPFARNLAMGAATGGWSQYDAVGTRDGHFVVFDDPAARDRAALFLGSFARDRAAGPRIE
jgi:hypothetical protein